MAFWRQFTIFPSLPLSICLAAVACKACALPFALFIAACAGAYAGSRQHFLNVFCHKIQKGSHTQGQAFLHRVNHMGGQFTRAPLRQQAHQPPREKLARYGVAGAKREVLASLFVFARTCGLRSAAKRRRLSADCYS